MKIRCAKDLLDKIDEESAWRKHEIVNIQGFALSNNRAKKVMSIAKSVVLISYSHWEGFVKMSSFYYLTFLKQQSFSNSQLAVRLLSSLYFWNNFKNNLSAEESIKCYEDMLSNNTHKFVYYIDDMCSTESNLSFKVLSKILFSIGLDSSSFLVDKPFIDERLLKFRNMFAHGDKCYDEDITVDAANEMAKKVVELIDRFRTELYNAITTEAYKRPCPN